MFRLRRYLLAAACFVVVFFAAAFLAVVFFAVVFFAAVFFSAALVVLSSAIKKQPPFRSKCPRTVPGTRVFATIPTVHSPVCILCVNKQNADFHTFCSIVQ